MGVSPYPLWSPSDTYRPRPGRRRGVEEEIADPDHALGEATTQTSLRAAVEEVST
jgi:hypothetical protein